MFKTSHLLLFSLLPLFGLTQTGTALDFDGVDDNAFTTNPALFDDIAGNDFTFEVWIKPESAGLSRIITAQSSATTFAHISLTSSNEIQFFVKDAALEVSEKTTTTLALDTWVHIAAVWHSATSSMELYLDGILQTTTAGSTTVVTGLDALGFGSVPFSGPEYFDGEMDDIRVWGEAREACDIQAFMNSQLYGSELNLERYFPIHEGTADGDNSAIFTLDDFSSVLTASLQNFDMGPGSSSNLTATGTAVGTVPAEGAFYSTETASICYGGSYTFPDGVFQDNITLFTTHYSTLSGAALGGCDSTVKTTISLKPIWDIMLNYDVCPGDDYTFVDGTVETNITAEVSHTSSYTTVFGCDSSITETVTPIIPEYIVNVSGSTLSAYEPGASWQWLDCDDGLSPIAGATGPEYDATSTGNYAVIVTVDGCPDTSDCVEVTEINGLDEGWLSTINIYPIPSNGELYVDLSNKVSEQIELNLLNLQGQILTHQIITDQHTTINTVDLPAGNYLVDLRSVDYMIRRKIVLMH